MAVRSSLMGIPAHSSLATASPPLGCPPSRPSLAHEASRPPNPERCAPIERSDQLVCVSCLFRPLEAGEISVVVNCWSGGQCLQLLQKPHEELSQQPPPEVVA